jgi:hypothetical protein
MSNSRFTRTNFVSKPTEQEIGEKLVTTTYKEFYTDYRDNIIPALRLIKTCITENTAFYDFLLSITNKNVSKLLTRIQVSTSYLEQEPQNDEDRYRLVVSEKQFKKDYFNINDDIANITTLIEFMYYILDLGPVSVSTSDYDDVFVLNINVTIIDVIIPILLENTNLLLTKLQEKYSSKNSKEIKNLNYYFDKTKINRLIPSRTTSSVAITFPQTAGKRVTKFRRQKRVLAQTRRALMQKKRYNITK